MESVNDPSSARPEPATGDSTPAMASPRIVPRGYGRVYRYYDLIMAAFVTVLLCTNLISAPKRVEVGGFIMDGGCLPAPGH